MKENESMTGGQAIACIAMLLWLMPLGWAFDAYVLMKMWGWFLVPFGIPMLSFKYALGLILFGGLYVKARVKDPRPDKTFSETIGNYLGSAFLVPALALGLGWIVVMVF